VAARRSDLPIPDDCPALLRCSRCKQEKPRELFVRNRSTATTFHHECNACNKERTLETSLRSQLAEYGIDGFERETERNREIVARREMIAREYHEGRDAAHVLASDRLFLDAVAAGLSRATLRQIARERLNGKLGGPFPGLLGKAVDRAVEMISNPGEKSMPSQRPKV
jgi:hypothetical protein